MDIQVSVSDIPNDDGTFNMTIDCDDVSKDFFIQQAAQLGLTLDQYMNDLLKKCATTLIDPNVPIEPFRKVSEKNGWMSNMASYPMTHEGVEYRSSEHAFQALKLKDESDRKKVMAASSGMIAKKIAHTCRSFDQSVDPLQLMYEVVKSKLNSNPTLITALLDTGTAMIVEDVAKRQFGSNLFWGGVPDFETNTMVRGENHLGKIFMRLRFEYRMGLHPTPVQVDPRLDQFGDS